MSRDGSSSRSIHRKTSQSLANENKYETSWNQIPLIPPRAPLNSIPDPSQYQLETRLQHFQHDVRETPESTKPSNSRKPEGISEAQHVSSVLRTPKGYCRGKSTNLELNSAQSTPIRSAPGVSNASAASGFTLSRLQSQLDNGGGRGGISRRVSGDVSIAFAQQLLADVPHFALVDDPSFWNGHNVQVLIRIRPLNSAEMISQGNGRCLRQESAQTVVWLGHPETRFTFDHIACESVSQEKLFRVAGLPMVDNCMSGYNSCMFAYGQTGSGKTYTMMGEINKMDGMLSDDSGITPRIFEYLFTRITKEEESRKHERLTYSCKCSFLEIYNEHITDLLEPSSTNLQLREDLKKGIYVENLTECSVRTVNDVLKLLQQGAANRKIAATHMNSESSRSHSVFTCVIESRWEKDSISHLRFGRLNLVDLAGSERQKSSGAEGDRLKEAANINKSLSTLGLVIMSLVDLAQGKHRHVPYRDSKLTFLLQDSLGGNSKTTIIANVSPSICSANETLSTLKFAQRAKLIQNNAKINEDASAGVIALQQQIQQLKDQLSFLMKHQHTSMELNFVPRPEQSSLGYFSESYEPPEDINMHDEHKTPKKSITKTSHGALQRQKLAETEVRTLKAEIEHLNNLAHQREEEVQHAKMMLRFCEERIKRLELLLDGSISADQFYLDENNALREENLILQAKLERNPEVTRCQDFCEQGERNALLAEISELRNQLSKSIEAEKSYARHQFFPMEEEQEPDVAKELVQCKDMNSKLIRKVNELQLQLANRMNSNQDTSNSIDNVPLRNDSVDEVTSNNLLSNGVIYDENEKMKYMLDLRCDNVHKQLMDAESLVETLKLEQLQLIKELKSSKSKNQLLMKLLDANEVTQRELEVQNEDCKTDQPHSANQGPIVSIEVSEGSTIEALQAKLEKLSEDLKEAQALNRQYIDDRATRLSEDLQIESIRNEVESETTRTIIQLQEEIDTLKSEFQVCLCSMAEQNLSLSKSVVAKEDELRMLCAEWERAALELTTFLIDGSRSLGDASRQIKSISSSFPNVNDWISEHVERAAKICIEKEETILLLQKSLEDAQNTVAQMGQKLYSLKGATIALTEFQKPEREKFLLSSDAAEAKKFPVNNSMSNKGQITDNQDNTPTLVENRISDYSTSTLRDTVVGNLPPVHTTAFASTDVGIQFNLASLILTETEDATTRICADAEIYLSALNSDIHNAISLYKGWIQDLLKDVSNMRKDIKELKGNPGNLHTFKDMIPACSVLKHENHQQMLQQIRNELVEVNNRLSSMSACFYKAKTMNCYLNSNGSFTETDGWTTDCSCSCSHSSVESADNDVKPSSTDRHRCTSKTAEQTLDLNSDEGSNLSQQRAVLLLREVMKVNEAFVKLKDHLVAFAISKIHQDCVGDILSISDLHALETLKEQRGDEHDQPTSKKAAAGTKSFGELVVDEKHNPTNSFFAKFEEAYATIEEADYMLKAMLKANENASTLTAMWKETGEELMADKARLSEEIKQLKSSVLLRDGEEEILQDDIKFSLAEEANILSLLEECSLAMQTGVEELFETARSDAIRVVEEMQLIFCSLRASSEDIMCKAMQSDISIFVLQCQMGEYCNNLRRLNTLSTSDRSALLEHCLGADNSEISCAGRDDCSVLHPLKCESNDYQIACVPRKENKVLDLVDGDTVDNNSELQRELEQKDILLKGLLLDFSLLQEFASHRKDIKDELEKLIVTLSEVQHELQIKRVELDDMLVQNNKIERRLSEAKQALFNSNSELDQAKVALDNLSEQNDELKDILKDLYLKNSEAEQLLEDQRDAIKSLEREIIRISSSSEKQFVPSLEDIEDALTEVTAERDHLVEKLNSLQDKFDIMSALADENQAIAAEARQESEASKLYAEQKEEEVKILEHSVEELDGTINVLEKKVHEMEEEVEKQRLIRDSLELELQSLRHRLLTVEDLTESMTSENSNAALLEDQLGRKLHVRSPEINEAQWRIRFLEEENARQAKEIGQFKDYIAELVLHAEAQASQYQQKYKSLEAMFHEVKTDLSNVSAVPTLERADKISARTRGSSSPFRCIVGLVQQMNQEKDQELSSARLRIEELEAMAASRYKEVCMLNTRLATAESMTHDVIRDLLSVKLDISNYANIVDQHQIEKLIEEAHHRRQEFVAMEQEIVKLRSQIDDLLEERERCIEEINRNKADQLATQIVVEQLREREHLLHAQNQMLKMDKSNLQKRITELDDMVKKLLSINQPQTNSSSRPFDYDLGERLAHSQKVLSRINNQLAQYRRPDGSSCPDDKKDRHSDQTKFRKQKP